MSIFIERYYNARSLHSPNGYRSRNEADRRLSRSLRRRLESLLEAIIGILSALFGRKNDESNDLVGCWHLVSTEAQLYEPTEADFRDDGRLYYSVLSGERWQIMVLRYRVEGDILVGDQPSAPREERGRFALAPDGTLTIEFAGNKGVFSRGEKKAPNVYTQ